MTWLMSKLTGWLALLGVLLSAGLAIFLKGRSIGTATERAKQQADDLKAIQTAKGIENEVDGLNGDDLDKRFSKWVR
jgi:hypothetical protein